MPEIIVVQRMEQRHATAAEWTTKNSILGDGEIGVEDSVDPAVPSKFKIGDAITPWNSLPYAVDGGGGGGAVPTGTGFRRVVDGVEDAVASFPSKSEVGLGNVDNTSDALKPVSTAQQTAIDAAIDAHEAAPDPHPQYLTPVEGDARYVALTGSGGDGDPYSANVAVGLHFDGTDGATSFPDITGRVWTPTNGAQVDTAVSKFGGGALLLADGDYMGTPTTADLVLGAGDFTIDGWFRPTKNESGYGNAFFLDMGINLVGGFGLSLSNNYGLEIRVGEAKHGVNTTAVINASTLAFLSISRVGATLYVGVNGTVTAHAIDVGNHTYAGTVYIGYGAGYGYSGHIDDFRITKGVARYTANFTPPTTAFPDSGAAAATYVASVNTRTGDVVLTKADVELGNVDNTSDALKPVSTAQQTALDAKADLVGGKIPTAQLPSFAIGETFPVASEAAMVALAAQIGDVAIRSDQGNRKYLLLGTAATAADWAPLDASGLPVDSVNGQEGAVVLGKADIGLGNVDNTSDALKPISTAQQAALDLKVSTANVGTSLSLTSKTEAELIGAYAQGLSYNFTSDTAKTAVTVRHEADNRVLQLLASSSGGTQIPTLQFRTSHTSGGGGGWTGLQTVWHSGNFDAAAVPSPMTPGSYGTTMTALVNLDTAVAIGANYMRMGNQALVMASANVDPTVIDTLTSFEMALPFTSAMTSLVDLVGGANVRALASAEGDEGGSVLASTTNDTAVIQWFARNTGIRRIVFWFMYTIK